MQLSIPFAVGIGGCAGALLRFYINGAVNRVAGDELAFIGTVTVNLIGCLLIGILALVVARTTHLSPHLQHLLIPGLLGSLTTFSTFALDCVNLLQQGRVGAAIANISINVIFGIVLVWLGMLAAGSVFTSTTVHGSEARQSSPDAVSDSES